MLGLSIFVFIFLTAILLTRSGVPYVNWIGLILIITEVIVFISLMVTDPAFKAATEKAPPETMRFLKDIWYHPTKGANLLCNFLLGVKNCDLKERSFLILFMFWFCFVSIGRDMIRTVTFCSEKTALVWGVILATFAARSGWLTGFKKWIYSYIVPFYGLGLWVVLILTFVLLALVSVGFNLGMTYVRGLISYFWAKKQKARLKKAGAVIKARAEEAEKMLKA